MLSTRKKTDSVIKVVSSKMFILLISVNKLCVGPINGVLNMIDF